MDQKTFIRTPGFPRLKKKSVWKKNPTRNFRTCLINYVQKKVHLITNQTNDTTTIISIFHQVAQKIHITNNWCMNEVTYNCKKNIAKQKPISSACLDIDIPVIY